METSRKMWCVNSLPVLGSDLILPTFHNSYQNESEKIFLHKNLDDGCYFLVFHKDSIRWRWGSILNKPPENLSLEFSQFTPGEYTTSFNNIAHICSFYPEYILLKLSRDIEDVNSHTHKIFVFLRSALSVRLISNGKVLFENRLGIPNADFDRMILIFRNIGS